MANYEAGSVQINVTLNDADFINKISKIKTELGSLNNIGNKFASKSDISRLQTDFKELQNAVKGVVKQIDTLTTSSSKMKTELNGIKDGLGQVDGKMKDLKASASDLRTGFESAGNATKTAMTEAETSLTAYNSKITEGIGLLGEMTAQSNAYLNNLSRLATEELRSAEAIERTAQANAQANEEWGRGFTTASSYTQAMERLAVIQGEAAVASQELSVGAAEAGMAMQELSASEMQAVEAANTLVAEEARLMEMYSVMNEQLWSVGETQTAVFTEGFEALEMVIGATGELNAEERVLQRTLQELAETQATLFTASLTSIEEISAAWGKAGMSAQEYAAQLYQIEQEQAMLNRELEAARSMEITPSGTSEMDRNTKSKNENTRATNSLDKASGLLRRTASLLAVTVGFELATSIWEASKQMVNAREEIKNYGQLAGWTGQQISSFSNQTQQLQKVYRKIDMTQVGSMVAKLGQQYGLTEKQAQSMIETSAVFTAAMAREGRSTNDAVLALKDYYDQGAGWTRRMQEIGVTEEKLKATGLWSGEKDDIEGMNAALEQVMRNMNLYDAAREITNPEEGWEAVKIQIAEVATELYEFFGPAITEAFQIWSDGLTRLKNNLEWLKQMLDGLPQPLKDLIKHITAITIAAAPFGIIAWQMKGTLGGIGGFVSQLLRLTGEGNIASKLRKIAESIGLIAKAEKEIPDIAMDEKPGGVGKGKLWETITQDMRNMARGAVQAAAGIAIAMGLITEVILLINGPLLALSATGWVFKQIEPGVRKGVEALTTVGPLLLGIGVSIGGLVKFMQVANITLSKDTIVTGMASIATALLLITEAVAGMIAPLLALAAVGSMFPNTDVLKKGRDAIVELNVALLAMLPELILFAGMTFLYADGLIPGLAATIGAAAAIGSGILLLTEAIIGMAAPLWALSTIGRWFPNMDQLKNGAEAIKQVSEALAHIAESFGSLATIAWDNFVIWITGNGNGSEVLNSIVEDNGILSNIANFARKINDAGNIPEVDQSRIENLAKITEVMSNVSEVLKNAGDISAQEFWDGVYHALGNYNGGSSSAIMDVDFAFDDLGELVTKINNLKLPEMTGDWDSKAEALGKMGEFMTKVKDTLGHLKDALDSANKAQSESGGLGAILAGGIFGFTGISDSIDTLVSDIKDLARGMSEINKIKITAPDFTGKIIAFQGLANFLKALEPVFRRIQMNHDALGEGDFYPKLQGVVYNIKKLPALFTELSGVAFADVNFTDITTKLRSFIDFLKALEPAINRINTISQQNVSADTSKIYGGLQSIVELSQKSASANIAVDFTSRTIALRSFIEFLKALEPAVTRISNFKSTDIGAAHNKVYSAVQSIVELVQKTSTATLTGDFTGQTSTLTSLNGFLDQLGPSVTKIANTSTSMGENFNGATTRLAEGFKSIVEMANKMGNENLSFDSLGINQFLTQLTTALSNAVTTINNAATNLYNAGHGVGTKLAEGIRSGLVNITTILTSHIQYAFNGATAKLGQARNVGHRLGASFATGVREGLRNLTKIVTSEIDYAIHASDSKKGAMAAAGRRLAAAYIDAFKKELDQQSPGKVARMVGQEVVFAVGEVINRISMMYNAGKQMAQGFMSGYSENANMDTFTPDVDTGNVDMQSLGVLQNQANAISTITAQTTTDTIGQFTTLDTTMATTFNDMGVNATTAFQGINTSNQTYLGQLNSETTKGLQSANNTTRNQLAQMRQSTTTVVGQMTNAWNSMKNNIVHAASSIRTQSYNKFASLHRSISSFYNQLASAHFTAGLATGPRQTGSHRIRIGEYGGNTGGRLRAHGSHLNRKPTPTFKAYGSGDLAGLSSNRKSRLYLDLLDNPDKTLLEQLRLLNQCSDGECYYGTVSSNYQRIKNTVDQYPVADPWFLGIQIPMDNHVYDWENGKTKRIDASNFEEILRMVLTARGFRNPGSYSYYANSMKSNQQVWDTVSCNCYDGAEVIAEIGQMLGLGGSITHGSWKGEGHMAAVVAGQIYDMTQFQKHGVFRGTPGVVFGPPKERKLKRNAHGPSTSSSSDAKGSGNNPPTVNITINGDVVGEQGFVERMKDIAEKIFFENQGTSLTTGI